MPDKAPMGGRENGTNKERPELLHKTTRLLDSVHWQVLKLSASSLQASQPLWTYPALLLSTRQEGVGTRKARQKHGPHHGSSDGTLIGDS